MFDPKDIHKIDRLRRGLYSRTNPFSGQVEQRAVLTNHDETPTDGTSEQPDGQLHTQWDPEPPQQQRKLRIEAESFFKKILLASILFFVLAGGVSAFILFGGFNIMSTHNVDIAVAGPVSVPGGSPLELDITVVNRNNTDFENATLLVTFPQGSREVENPTTPVTEREFDVSLLKSGKSKTIHTNALLFGEENTVQKVLLTLEYTTANNKTVITKEKEYEVALSAAPVTVRVSALKEINAGQTFPFTIDVESNSNSDLSNVLVTAEYPFGFEFVSASPTPMADRNVWLIKELKPGEKKTVTINGKFQGQDGEERVVRFAVGSQSTVSEKAIDTLFGSVVHSIGIRKPFIGIDVAINGSTNPEYALSSSGRSRVTVRWKNNLPARITDAQIEVKVNGTILDRSSIQSGNGFFRSIDNTILWNKQNDNALALISPGDSGDVEFSFATIDGNLLYGGQYRSPTMNIEVSVKGKRVSENQVPEEVTSSVMRTIKVSTRPTIEVGTLYASGPIRNTGPIPPRVEQPTTFTVVWRVRNPINNLSDATVSATLPQYVSWKGVTSPAGENIKYSAETRQVIWQAGQVRAGTGISGTAPREAMFQVELLPSLTQRGENVPLTGRVEFEATDAFTNAELGATTDAAAIGNVTDAGTRELRVQ